MYAGRYDQGESLERMAEISGYYKYYDERNQLIYVRIKDNNDENDGFCYYFDNNNGGLTIKQTNKQLIDLQEILSQSLTA